MLEVCAACPAVPHPPEEMFHLPGWKWHQPRCSRYQLCPLKGMVPALARQHLQPSVWAPVCALSHSTSPEVTACPQTGSPVWVSLCVPWGHSMFPDWQLSAHWVITHHCHSSALRTLVSRSHSPGKGQFSFSAALLGLHPFWGIPSLQAECSL